LINKVVESALLRLTPPISSWPIVFPGTTLVLPNITPAEPDKTTAPEMA
jgi:hypothetical protein